MASSRTLLDTRNGAKLWLVDLGGGLNKTYFVDCPRFEQSLAFDSHAEAAAYLRGLGAPGANQAGPDAEPVARPLGS